MANLRDVRKHSMTDEQLDSQWIRSLDERKGKILEDAKVPPLRAAYLRQKDLATVSSELTDLQFQTVVNRLAMDANYLD